MLRRILLAGVVAAALGSPSQARGDEPYLTWLGRLPGYSTSQAHAVSDDGSVVVGRGGAFGFGEAFRWTIDEGIVGLGFLPTSYDPWSGAYDVSADGSVAIGTSSSDELGLEAFRWTPETGMIGLGTVPGSSAGTQGAAVSADGSVVVGAVRACQVTAVPFRWTEAEGMQRLDEEARGATPIGISDDSLVVVGVYRALGGPREPFRWTTEQGLELLGTFPDGDGNGEAINTSADGAVVVGWSNPAGPSSSEAFRWTADGGMVGLGFLPGSPSTVAWGVSADGAVIGGVAEIPASGSDAFLWTEAAGLRDLQRVLSFDLGLDIAGADLRTAYGISANGRYIVGGGVNPDGNYEACLAYLGDPIPCKGDLNADGERDLADLSILLASYGTDAGGDIDGDTDLRDLAWLLAVYAEPCLQW